MSDSLDPYGKKVYEYLSKNKYDVVILQEQSVRPIIDKEKFHEAVRKLYKLIIKNEATPLLYETWGDIKIVLICKNLIWLMKVWLKD